MSRKLQNYLKTYRRRIGLTQDEMALLLGCLSGAKVSRYEHFTRLPSLKTVFAYEVIFGIPARELFAGTYETAEEITLKRVRALVKGLSDAGPDLKTMQKLEILRLLISEGDEQS